jgi:hypothetical protein
VIHLVALSRLPQRPLPEFFAVLGENSTERQKVMPGVWLVDTWLDAMDLQEVLLPEIARPGDSLFIIRVRSDYAGYVDRDALDWLRRAVATDRFRI